MTEQAENQESLSESKKKPGRKPKADPLQARIDELEKKLDQLTLCFERVATDGGHGNKIVEMGFKRYDYNKEDFKRFREL